MNTPLQPRVVMFCIAVLVCGVRPAHALRLETQLALPAAVRAGEKASASTGPVLAYLRGALGKRYQRGATGDNQAYDCSGLVQRAYQAAGLQLPRHTSRQIAAGQVVTVHNARAGDLLFYRFGRGAEAGLHVAVYIGGGRAIHASVSHRIVREDNVTTDSWARHFVTAIRPA